MKPKKNQGSSSRPKPFASIEEIAQETGFAWRTVRNRLRDAGLHPLSREHDRDEILDAIGAPLPTYTAEQEAEINARIDALRAREAAR